MRNLSKSNNNINTHHNCMACILYLFVFLKPFSFPNCHSLGSFVFHVDRQRIQVEDNHVLHLQQPVKHGLESKQIGITFLELKKKMSKEVLTLNLI